MRIRAQVTPSTLLWARRTAGLALDEVARKIGSSARRIESWENGEDQPTINQLRKLADVYRRPLPVFFLVTPPEDDPAPSDFRRFDPAAAEPLSSQLRFEIRRARARRAVALDLLDELGEQPPSLELSAKIDDDPEVLGERLHETIRAGNSIPRADARLIFNYWRAASERAGVLVFQAEDVEVEEMRGFSISDHPLPAVVLNIKDAYAARSFSLFHELTHIALGRGGLCVFEERGARSEGQRVEVFCNHVAGAALMPAKLLINEPEAPKSRVRDVPDSAVAAIARRYGVSEEVVLRRFVLLNRVSRTFYQRKREAYQRRFDRLRKERSRKGFAPPHNMAVATAGPRFTRLVLEAFDEERITASDVSEYLRIRLKHLDRIRTSVRTASGTGEFE